MNLDGRAKTKVIISETELFGQRVTDVFSPTEDKILRSLFGLSYYYQLVLFYHTKKHGALDAVSLAIP
jgi:hypothetical protein